MSRLWGGPKFRERYLAAKPAIHRARKLNERQVSDIRQAVAQGHPLRKIARQLKISHRTVSDIVHGRTWRTGAAA